MRFHARLSLGCLLCFASLSFGGWILEEETTFPGGDRLQETIQIQQGHLSLSPGAGLRVVVSGSTAHLVDASRGVFWTGSVHELLSHEQAEDFATEGDEFSGLSEEDKRMLQEMGFNVEEEMAQMGAPLTVKGPSGSESIAGVPARKFEVHEFGELVEELWLSTTPGPGSEFDLLLLSRIRNALDDMVDNYSMPTPEYEKLVRSGYPLRRVLHQSWGDRVETVVRSIQRANVPDSEFAVADGMRRVGLNDFLGEPAYDGDQGVGEAGGGWSQQGTGGTVYGGGGKYGGDSPSYGEGGWPDPQRTGSDEGVYDHSALGSGQSQPAPEGDGYANDQDSWDEYSGAGGGQTDPFASSGSSPAGNQGMEGGSRGWGGSTEPSTAGISQPETAGAGGFTHPYGFFSVALPRSWVFAGTIGAEEKPIYVLQKQPQYDAFVYCFDEILPASESAFHAGVEQVLQTIYRSVSPRGNASPLSGSAQGSIMRTSCRDYQAVDAKTGQSLDLRVLTAYCPHYSLLMIGGCLPNTLSKFGAEFDEIYRTLRIVPPNQAAAQSIVGTWQGVSSSTGMTFWDGSGNAIGGTGGSSSEHLLTFYSDGTCSDYDYTSAAMLSRDGMQYGDQQTYGQATSQSRGRYFVVGNRVFYEAGDEFYVLDGSEQGVLQSGNLRYIRQ